MCVMCVYLDCRCTSSTPHLSAPLPKLRNDGRTLKIEDNLVKEYERLVRRVLSLPNRPPLIMMQVCAAIITCLCRVQASQGMHIQ